MISFISNRRHEAHFVFSAKKNNFELKRKKKKRKKKVLRNENSIPFCSRFPRFFSPFFPSENALKVPRNSLRNVRGKLGESNGFKPSFSRAQKIKKKREREKDTRVRFFFPPSLSFSRPRVSPSSLLFLSFLFSRYNITVYSLQRDIVNNTARYVGP